MALADNNTNGTLTGGTDTLITGNAAGTLIKTGALRITNKTTGTVGDLQIIIDIGGTSKDMFNATLNPGASWINDGDIILKSASDLVKAVGTASTFDYSAFFFDDFLG
jgi:hypothetical protein